MPTAWEMIGTESLVRIKGGTAVYEAVIYYDDTPGDKVKLARMHVTAGGDIRQVNRYVDADTELEVVPEELAEGLV